MLPPKKTCLPSAPRMAAIMAAVVDLPFEPVTPIIGPGQRSRNSSSSLVIGTPRESARSIKGWPGRTAGLTTIRSASSKSASRCPARCQAAIRTSANACNESASVSGVAVSVTVTIAPCSANQRDGHAATMPAQAHHRYASAANFHVATPSPFRRRLNQTCQPNSFTTSAKQPTSRRKSSGKTWPIVPTRKVSAWLTLPG